MIEPPYEWAKSERHIYDYYKYVTDRTNIAIILLNTPHSGRLMSPDLLSSLADFPAVCAVKDGINDWNLANRHWKAVHDRVVLSLPREEEAMMCLMYWKQQVQLGTSAIFQLQTQDWKPVRRYVELAYQGRYDEAFEIWSALGELREMWSDKYEALFSGSPEHPIVWTKAWMDVMGMKGGRVRTPARNLDPAVKAEYQKNIKEAIARAQANPLFQRAPYLEGAVAAARS
jgi:4-hydroxy-tetrahydrodipicolinate synthase